MYFTEGSLNLNKKTLNENERGKKIYMHTYTYISYLFLYLSTVNKICLVETVKLRVKSNNKSLNLKYN